MRLRPTRWTSLPVQASRFGQFRIAGLAEGEYVLCAAPAPRALRVDPCFWLNASSPGPTLRLAAGQTISGQTVRLLEARRLRVRVADPQRALGTRQTNGAPRDLRLWLAGPPGAMLVHLQATRPTRDGQTYEVLVPANYAPRLAAHATGLRLADEFQRELPATAHRQTIQLPAAATQVAQVIFNISPR